MAVSSDAQRLVGAGFIVFPISVRIIRSERVAPRGLRGPSYDPSMHFPSSEGCHFTPGLIAYVPVNFACARMCGCIASNASGAVKSSATSKRSQLNAYTVKW